MGSERSGRDPMPILPITPPMDEVHGIISIRFAEVLVRCLCFPLSTYVIHAVNENHFVTAQNTGKLWGLRPQTPMKIKNKRFKPYLLYAFRGQQVGKNGGYSPPNPQPGCRLVAMGTTARLTPRLTHCSGPWTRSVWLTALWTRHNLGKLHT